MSSCRTAIPTDGPPHRAVATPQAQGILQQAGTGPFGSQTGWADEAACSPAGLLPRLSSRPLHPRPGRAAGVRPALWGMGCVPLGIRLPRHTLMVLGQEQPQARLWAGVSTGHLLEAEVDTAGGRRRPLHDLVACALGRCPGPTGTKAFMPSHSILAAKGLAIPPGNCPPQKATSPKATASLHVTPAMSGDKAQPGMFPKASQLQSDCLSSNSS
ncbi:hypothetical protein P7K49_040214 [Saguinus oedipus]|uniref:Uncharacterized protein n=1 Tax=Saguinus oedipus TaxID=9490 RepID=A0ABQ9T8N9_SAGOE|nr:hypothetical protein P7K49_040214 [Saguinus oedipus]